MRTVRLLLLPEELRSKDNSANRMSVDESIAMVYTLYTEIPPKKTIY